MDLGGASVAHRPAPAPQTTRSADEPRCRSPHRHSLYVCRRYMPLCVSACQPPAPRGGERRLARVPGRRKSEETSRLYIALRLIAAAGLAGALLSTPPTQAEARSPLTAWADGVSESADALARGELSRAEASARAAASALPDGEAGARANLALGLSLLRLDRPADAARALERSLPRLGSPSLASLASFELARALAGSGRPAAAAAIFGDLAARAKGDRARRARWAEPEALLRSGAATRAARTWELLLAAEPGASLAVAGRKGLADALWAAGEIARAISLYRGLWIDNPADPASFAAERALEDGRRRGLPIPDAAPDERIARAARLLELALPREAVSTLDGLHDETAGPQARVHLRLLRALAFVQLGRRDEASLLAREVAVAPAGTQGTRAGAELVLARVAARSGNLEEAVERYGQLSREGAVDIPGVPPSQARALPEEAGYLAAWLLYDAKLYGRALEALRAYARSHPGARRLEDARWFEAWSLERMGRRDEARRAMERLARGPLGAAALDWEAQLTPAREGRRALLRKVSATAPGSWYALLAAGWLRSWGERPVPLPVVTEPAPPDGPGRGEEADALGRAAALLGAGLPADAVAELRAMKVRGRETAWRIAQLANAAGDAELPFRMARDHLSPSRRALRWLYPKAFPDVLPRAAAQARVDPYLYLALMRRESGFRVDVRSPAGAVGLVQLIPPTAERIATLYGLAHDATAGPGLELDRPDVSIPIGAVYLSLLTERFRDTAPVLAAYNAGPSAAAVWARAGSGKPLERWVEEISFRETRHYVKNVSADAAVYRALWEGGPLAIDPRRPVPGPGEGVGF